MARHFADYEWRALRPIRREAFPLPEERKSETEVKDFEGHMLEAFKLRGKATSLGYTRGPAQDAGWFHYYRKSFVSLGLESYIEFTGNSLPEENRTVALLPLSFCRAGEVNIYLSDQHKLPLERVPPVLLSEAWNDLRSIAAQGSGFDPEWRKKSEC